MASLSTIENLKKEIKKWKKLAYKDKLTNLYNRRGFIDSSKKILKEITNTKTERRKKFIIKNCSLVLFDIDNFKKINDKFGHNAGDKALKALSSEIKKRVRDIDVLGRWGGEEIILLLVGADKENGFYVADYIRQKIENKKIKTAKGFINVTISGGVVDFKKEKDFEKVFKLADKALYKAKKTGKNKIVIAK
jgi:diguanylate cyclase (GGDEF)-like protein